MERHTWREKTEEGLRFFRASYFAGNWTLQSQLKGEEDWRAHEPIAPEEWRTLRDILWRKYQRGRGAWKLIEQIDKHLGEPGEGGGGGERRGEGNRG